MCAFAFPSVRKRRVIVGAALTITIGAAAHAFVSVHSSADPNELLLIAENWKLCADTSQPKPKRLASCSMVIAEGNRGMVNSSEVADVYVQRGQLFQDSGDDRAALQDFNAAVKSDPKNEHVWIGRANYYEAKSNFEHALSDYTQALKIKPDDPVAFDNRGITLTTMGKHDEALADFNRALMLNSHDLIAYSNRC